MSLPLIFIKIKKVLFVCGFSPTPHSPPVDLYLIFDKSSSTNWIFSLQKSISKLIFAGYTFFLFNDKAKIRQGLFFLKNLPQKKLFLRKFQPYFLCTQTNVYSFYIFARVIIWPSPPTHLVIKHHHLATPPTPLFDDVILEWSLSTLQ